jgi:nucleoside-diphosphate-sugar epimerase
LASEFGLPADDLRHAAALVGSRAWRQLDGGRVLITGGTGFIGKWLLASALHAARAEGLSTEFVVLSRKPSAFAVAHPDLASAEGVTLVDGDVRDFEFPPGELTHVVHGATDVVASNSPEETFDVTVTGTRRVLECAAASGATEFLLISSGAVYGPQPATVQAIPESYLGAPSLASPASAYGEGKRVAEWLTNMSSGEQLAPRVARCFSFVGPHLALDRGFAIGNFIADAMAGRQIEIQGDGTAHRSYLYAADLAGWLWALLLRGVAGATYNVGGEEALSIAELARRVKDVIGSTEDVRVAHVPHPGEHPARYVPDVSLIRHALRLPEPIPLDDALRRTVAWHRETARRKR